MAENIKLKPGECVDSVSYDKRVSTDAVWDDGNNTAIHDLRKNRNVMMENDPLHIPDPIPVWHNGKHTGLTHIFRLELPKREFRIQILRGAPLKKGYTYEVKVDGEVMKVVQDGPDDNFWLVCQIKPNAKVAEITIHYPLGVPGGLTVKKEHKYTVKLGHMRPVDTPEGREDRLKNLGYMRELPNRGDDKLTRGVPTAAKALSLFQARNDVDPAAKDAVGQTADKLKSWTGDPI